MVFSEKHKAKNSKSNSKKEKQVLNFEFTMSNEL